MEEIEIDEVDTIKDKFKDCYSVIELEDRKSEEFLEEDEQNNILLIRKYGDNQYKVNCYSRLELKEIIKRRFEPPFLVKTCKNGFGLFSEYYPLNIGDVECLFRKDDIRNIINSEYRIYYVERIDSVDCQGRRNDLYKIKVCGGEKCLERIFMEDQYEVESDEESDEEFENESVYENLFEEAIDFWEDYGRLQSLLENGNYEEMIELLNEIDDDRLYIYFTYMDNSLENLIDQSNDEQLIQWKNDWWNVYYGEVDDE